MPVLAMVVIVAVIVMRMPLDGMRKEDATRVAELSVRANCKYTIARIFKNDLVLFAPKSIAFHNMKHSHRVALVADLEGVIEHETRMKVEELMAHAHQI